MYKRIEKISPEHVAVEAIKDNTNRMLDANLDQLLNGQTNTGADIRPTYYEDDYFESYADAQAYSNWKDKISPYSPLRKSGTPNLFINGYFHSTIKVRVEGDKIVYGSDFDEADSIEEKYHYSLYGLSPKSKILFINTYLRPVFKKYIEATTGLKFK